MTPSQIRDLGLSGQFVDPGELVPEPAETTLQSAVSKSAFIELISQRAPYVYFPMLGQSMMHRQGFGHVLHEEDEVLGSGMHFRRLVEADRLLLEGGRVGLGKVEPELQREVGGIQARAGALVYNARVFGSRGRARFAWPTVADDEVVQILRTDGFQSVVERLDYLNAVVAEDPEYEADAIHPDSVSAFGKFLLSAKPKVRPFVGLHPSAYVFAQWRIKGGARDELWSGGEGSLSIVFEPLGLARFAARAGQSGGGSNVAVVNGLMPAEAIAGALEFFLARAVVVDGHVY